jgi:hypothetical protein
MMDSPERKTGGPAFPRPLGNNGRPHFEDSEVSSDQEGMSLRDYFAAHAPRDWPEWYQPTMPPRPAIEWGHDHPHEPRCRSSYDCIAINLDELEAYDRERRRQFSLQWPYAWADAMLAERAKGPS